MRNKNSKIFAFILIMIGATGIGVILYTTVWGVGFIDWDSFNYISVARSLAAGRGFVYPLDPENYAPLTNFPPFLPITLAIFEFLGMDAIITARILNAFLFGLSAILFALSLWKEIHLLGFAVLGALLFLFSSSLIFFHSFALAEPLYIFLTILGFLLLGIFLQNRKFYLLILTGCVLGLATLTRFVGITNTLTTLLVLALYYRTNLKEMIKGSVAVIILAIGPILTWSLYKSPAFQQAEATLDPAGIETVAYKFVPGDFTSMFLSLYHTFFQHFLPNSLVVGHEKVGFILISGIFLLSCVGIFLYNRNKEGINFASLIKITDRNPTLLTYSIYLIVYFLALIVFTIFGEAVVGERMQIPTLFAALIVIVLILAEIWKTGNRVLRILSFAISFYLVLFTLLGFVQEVPGYHQRGLGLGRKSFYNSDSIQLLHDLPAGEVLYTNYPWALYLHTGIMGYRVSNFSPVKVTNDHAWIVLYDYESIRSPGFIKKYDSYLEPITNDPHISIYLFSP